MINLLSPFERKQIKAAHANAILMRYVIIAPIIVGLIVVEMIVVYIILATSQTISKNTIANNEQKAAQYNSVKQEAENYRSNLSIAKYILSTQAPYTDILTAIAQKMPSGTTLTIINIDPLTFGSAVKLEANVQSHNQAIEVKNYLQKATIKNVRVFDSVSLDLSTVSSQENQDGSYHATYSVTYSKKVLP